MGKYNFKYPLLFLKENEGHLSSMDKDRFGLVSVGGGGFYKNLLIIDSDGQSIKITKINRIKNAPFKYWIIYFQRMLEVEYEYEIGKVYSLDEAKEVAMAYVERKKKFWLALDTIDGIRERVNNAKSYTELYCIFK